MQLHQNEQKGVHHQGHHWLASCQSQIKQGTQQVYISTMVQKEVHWQSWLKNINKQDIWKAS